MKTTCVGSYGQFHSEQLDSFHATVTSKGWSVFQEWLDEMREELLKDLVSPEIELEKQRILASKVELIDNISQSLVHDVETAKKRVG